MYNNIFSSYVLQWLTFTSGVTGNGNLFGDSEFWRNKFGEMYFQHRAFKDLEEIVGNDTTVFQDWLKHPEVDQHLKQLELTAEQYRTIKVPILTITASYDADQPGAMAGDCTSESNPVSPERQGRPYPLCLFAADHQAINTDGWRRD